MIYLIAKIFVYLLFALGLGGAAGWLWRNLQAATREGELERQLMESRGRLPQLDTTLRAREERLETTLAALKARDQSLAEQQQQLAERDRAVAELERACAELQRRLEAPSPASAAMGDGSGEVLALHPGDPNVEVGTPASSLPPAAVASAAAPALAAEQAAAAAESERDALHADLTDTRAELERTRSALNAEQRRVTELTRERELQHQALKALEQQLAMAREDGRRVANAG